MKIIPKLLRGGNAAAILSKFIEVKEGMDNYVTRVPYNAAKKARNFENSSLFKIVSFETIEKRTTVSMLEACNPEKISVVNGKC